MGSLTDTECRIAGLVAQGEDPTNWEVASAMFVTENTVQIHVRHIFQKLGERSCTQLTALFPLRLSEQHKNSLGVSWRPSFALSVGQAARLSSFRGTPCHKYH